MRSVKAGDSDWEIGYSWCTEPMDTGPFYKGLPNDTCPCEHLGYVLEGSVRIIYDDGTEEKISQGDVYHIPAGHHFIYDEPAKLIEFNRHECLQKLMNHFNEGLAKAKSEGTLLDHAPTR